MNAADVFDRDSLAYLVLDSHDVAVAFVQRIDDLGLGVDEDDAPAGGRKKLSDEGSPDVAGAELDEFL